MQPKKRTATTEARRVQNWVVRDNGAAVADRGAVNLRVRQGRELLAGAVAGNPPPGGDKVGGVLEALFFVGFPRVSWGPPWGCDGCRQRTRPKKRSS